MTTPDRSRRYGLFGVDLDSGMALRTRLAPPRGGRSLVLSEPAPGEGIAPGGGRGRLLYGSPLRAGLRSTELRRLDDGSDLLCFGAVGEFRLGVAVIECRAAAPGHSDLVELRFLGPVMAFWLELQGLPALHASAVVLGHRAVAFLSGNGGGKTSLAAALIQAGHPLLTDDVLAVEPASSGEPAAFLARPGYPQMRMWPRDAERFLGSAAGLERVHPRYSKLRVPVGEGGFGTFHHDPAPLGAVYLVERGEAAAPCTPARIEPLPPHRALIELVRHSFVPRLVEAAGLQPRRLELLARLVERVSVRRLVVPSGPGGLASARAAVLAEI
jgi:hypothetical protein